jgi:hypothetical protein
MVLVEQAQVMHTEAGYVISEFTSCLAAKRLMEAYGLQRELSRLLKIEIIEG